MKQATKRNQSLLFSFSQDVCVQYSKCPLCNCSQQRQCHEKEGILRENSLKSVIFPIDLQFKLSFYPKQTLGIRQRRQRQSFQLTLFGFIVRRTDTSVTSFRRDCFISLRATMAVARKIGKVLFAKLLFVRDSIHDSTGNNEDYSRWIFPFSSTPELSI